MVESLIYAKPDSLTHVGTHYCPGCTHGVAHRLVAETLDEMGVREQTIGVAPVGCSVFAYNYFNIDFAEAAHGRAPAMATGHQARQSRAASSSPIRATATWRRSARRRSCTPPDAARTSPSSSSTTPSTA